MTNLALLEVQHALYNKLHGDGVLMGMLTGLYDVVPQRTALPYAVIGDGQVDDIPADAVNLTQLRLRLDIWADASGRKPVLAIMNRMFALLHLGTLTISGFQQVLLRCDQADTSISEEATRVRGTMIVSVTVAEV